MIKKMRAQKRRKLKKRILKYKVNYDEKKNAQMQ